jgi:phosphopantetheinyl transferase
MHFNVSHSADLVVYTFCRDAEVGTDVEYLDGGKRHTAHSLIAKLLSR